MKDEFDRVTAAIAYLRGDHYGRGLEIGDLDPDPFVEFTRWMEIALQADIHLPNAMTLATASPSGVPSARTVLLKGIDEQRFVFYTNYESRKGKELAANASAALVFFWRELGRQISVTGPVERVARAESDAYFRTRPRGSRLGAWASKQSEPVPSRAVLESALVELDARFSGDEIPRPPHWGGFALRPDVIEFWQSRPDRLHDRFRYMRRAENWTVQRLSP